MEATAPELDELEGRYIAIQSARDIQLRRGGAPLIIKAPDGTSSERLLIEWLPLASAGLLRDTRELKARGSFGMRDTVRLAAIESRCLRWCDQPSEAEEVIRSVIANIREPEDNNGLGEHLLTVAWGVLAELLIVGGRQDEAKQFFEEAASRAISNGDWRTAAHLWMSWAHALDNCDSTEEAEAANKRALAIAEPQGASAALVGLWVMLGHRYERQDRIDEATNAFRRGYKIVTSLGDQLGREYIGEMLFRTAVRRGDVREQLKHASSAMRRADESGEESELRWVQLRWAFALADLGRCTAALNILDPLIASLRPLGSSLDLGVALAARAQALEDLKRFDEAGVALEEAASMLEDTALKQSLELARGRVARAKSDPLSVDCAHRVIDIALGGVPGKLRHHDNPQPATELTLDAAAVLASSPLSPQRRAEFRELDAPLAKESDRTESLRRAAGDAPPIMRNRVVLRLEEDVERFETDWIRHQREIEELAQWKLFEQEWENMRALYPGGAGVRSAEDVFRYVASLIRVVDAHVLTHNVKIVREAALHAADFLEANSNHPVAACGSWVMRASLLTAVSQLQEHGGLPDPDALELLEVELRRCTARVKELLKVNEPRARAAILRSLVVPWVNLSRCLLGRVGYQALIDTVGSNVRELAPFEQLQYAVALGELGDYRAALMMIDLNVHKLKETMPHGHLILPRELEVARAKFRFLAQCEDGAACLRVFGPFAPYVHREMSRFVPNLFSLPAAPGSDKAVNFELIARPAPLAFASGHLVVVDERLLGSELFEDVIKHELAHILRRAGQQLQTADGKWRRVTRDVPIASALTYLRVLECSHSSLPSDQVESVRRLAEVGRVAAQQDQKDIVPQVKNMLRYFDDLSSQESGASYPCAALLAGIALSLVGELGQSGAKSYVAHLALVDHELALEFAKARAELRW